VPEWGEPGDVGRVDRVSVRGEVVEGGLDVYGLPQHDDVDHDAEAVELVFLPGLLVLPQLAALAVEDGAGQGVAPLAAAERVVDGPPVGRVVGVFEHVQGLDHPAELGPGTGGAGGAGPRCNVRKIAEGMTVPARSGAVSRQISSQLPVMSRVLMRLRASPFSGP